MEKLIELYNKHLQDRGLTHKCVEWEVKENINMLDQLKLFVKRLVENDKIDYKKTHGEEWYYKLVDTCDYNGEKRCDVLLMLLSIQDEPVKFLYEILK